MRKPYFENSPQGDRYNFAVSLVRCFENSFIDLTRYERMMEAADVSSALKILHDTPYGTHVQSSPGDFENVLVSRKREARIFFDEYCFNRHAKDFISSPYDYHNLKTAVKSRFSNVKRESYSEFGSVPRESFMAIAAEEKVEEGDGSKLPVHLEKALEACLEGYYLSKDPRRIDYAADISLFERLSYDAENSKSEYIKELLALRADFTNAVSFLRIKKGGEEVKNSKDLFVPGGKISAESISDCLLRPMDDFKGLFSLSEYYDAAAVIDAGPFEMEKKADEMEMEFLRQSRYFLSGFEPLVSYCLSLDIEIRNLRRIFVSKRNKIPFDKFRKGITEVA